MQLRLWVKKKKKNMDAAVSVFAAALVIFSCMPEETRAYADDIAIKNPKTEKKYNNKFMFNLINCFYES